MSTRVIIDNCSLQRILDWKNKDELAELRSAFKGRRYIYHLTMETLAEVACAVKAGNGAEILRARASLILELAGTSRMLRPWNKIVIDEVKNQSPVDPFLDHRSKSEALARLREWSCGIINNRYLEDLATAHLKEKSSWLEMTLKHKAGLVEKFPKGLPSDVPTTIQGLRSLPVMLEMEQAFLRSWAQKFTSHDPDRAAKRIWDRRNELPYIDAYFNILSSIYYLYYVQPHDGTIGAKPHEGDESDGYLLNHMVSVDCLVTEDKRLRTKVFPLSFARPNFAISSAELVARVTEERAGRSAI